MSSHSWQVRFMLNGRDRIEKVPAPTRYDAAEYVRVKYPTDAVFVYSVRPDREEVAA